MAHADHDQVIGRIAGARLRGAGGRPLGGAAAAAEAHPDAETWAAYVDGGLLADEVSRLEAHLAGCGTCRRLVAAVAPEVSAAAAPVVRDAEAPVTAGATIIPFPRRRVFAYMGIAAALFGAVTVWSVSRLGSERPAVEFAASRSDGDGADRAAGAPMAAPSPSAPSSPVAQAAPTIDALAARRQAAPSELDKLLSPAGGAPAGGVDDTLRRAETAARARTEPGAAAGPISGGVAPLREDAKPAEEKRLADAAAAVLRQAVPPSGTPVPAPAPAQAANARAIQLQTNTMAGGAARPHGPLANQAANAQQNAPAAPAPTLSPVAVTPVAAVAAPPPAAPAVASGAVAPAAPASAPSAPADTRTAQADTGAANPNADGTQPRERPANEQQAAVSEIVTTTGRVGGRAARPQAARGQAAAANGFGPAVSKDESAKTAASSAEAFVAALPSFAEPSGRLLWRIAADGRRIESSSDRGASWNGSHTVRGRLRAGAAPSIDTAWVVGDRGLVLRLTVPGGWAAVAPPENVTLTAVSATSAQSARVTAADGRVFETADGGATWTSATPGAGPQ